MQFKTIFFAIATILAAASPTLAAPAGATDFTVPPTRDVQAREAAPLPVAIPADVPVAEDGLEDAAAVVAERDFLARGEVVARLQSWTAVGGCKTDWKNKCYAQCVGEGVTKHGCNQANVSSGIESSHCVWGWNICRCHC